MSMPMISFLGTMMSLTVTFSRSSMLMSISWWFLGMSVADSFTRVLSSSLLKWFSLLLCVLKPRVLSRKLVTRLMHQTMG